MKPANGQGLEAIAIKRAALADADKVRYRVYREPDDFIAVIAESALMAMKVSGVSNPIRIVRDLPTEGVAIEAKKMARVEGEERILLPVAQQVKEKTASQFFMKAELPEKPAEPQDARFVPMHLRDLERKVTPWARVLTPEMVEQIAKPKAKTPPVAPMPETVEPTPPEPEAVMEPAAAPEPVHAEPVTQPASAAPADNAERPLSPEEVERLLNS